MCRVACERALGHRPVIHASAFSPVQNKPAE
jgi:hypothetical protein